MITRYLPARWRVAISTVRMDARDTVRALREPRFKGVRVREVPLSTSPRVTKAPPGAPAPSRDLSAEPQQAAESVIVFADSGIEVTLAPGQYILDAGLGQGVDLLFSCTLGGCGACMLQIVEGEVEYDDPDAICLTEDEIADGCCLACVGRPRGRVVVEA